jgi:hypothetical protein
MPLSNKTYSIIVPSANANLTGHTYGQVYADTACTPTINGVAINMVAGGTIDIVVTSISATAGCFLIGDPIDPTYPSVIIG